MDNEQKAIHLEVLSAINGRIRLQLERPVASAAPFRRIPGMRGCRYNARIRTLLCEYDPEVISEEQLIVRLGAAYAAQTDASLLHIKRSEEEGFSMAPSGYLALLCIGLDGVLSLAGSPLTTFTRWLSTGATLAAVVEHGYQELHVVERTKENFRRVFASGLLAALAMTECNSARGCRKHFFDMLLK